MQIEYHLHPPILYVAEETSFPNTWEAFCRTMLSVAHGTEDVTRRAAPDAGVDLYLREKRIAFQCKSVEFPGGRVNISNACDSLRQAIKNQPALDWTQYELCTNIDLTANQETKLREVSDNVIIRGKSYWHGICRKHPNIARRFFRAIGPVSTELVYDTLTHPAAINVTQSIREDLAQECMRVLFYVHRYDRVYEIGISPSSTVSDVVQQLQTILRLPFSHANSHKGVFVTVNYSLICEGKRLFGNDVIGQLGISENSVLTLEVAVSVRDNSGAVESRSMAAFEIGRNQRPEYSDSSVCDIAMSIGRDIEKSIDRLDNMISGQ